MKNRSQVVSGVLAIAIGSLLACSDTPTEPARSKPVLFETLYLSQGSGIEARRGEVISDPNRWSAVWSEIHQGRSPQPPLPPADFERELVILAAMGSAPDSCWRIEVKSVTFPSRELEVAVEENRAPLDCACLTVIVNPVHVVRASRTAEIRARFQFDRRITAGPCR